MAPLAYKSTAGAVLLFQDATLGNCSHTGAGRFAYGAFAGLFGAGLFAQVLVEHEMRKH